MVADLFTIGSFLIMLMTKFVTIISQHSETVKAFIAHSSKDALRHINPPLLSPQICDSHGGFFSCHRKRILILNRTS